MSETAQSLLDEAWRMAPRQRVETLVRAVEMADAEGDLDLAFRAREDLVHASYYVPGAIELVSSYSWLIARHDEDPERFPLNLWSYKWVVNALPQMLAVSSEQIEQVVSDLETRLEASGQGPAIAAKLRVLIAQQTGELDDLERLTTEWRDALMQRRGWLNDCSACDESAYVESLVMLGLDEEAIAEAKGLIAGDSTCSTEPHYALSMLIAPARRVGTDGLGPELRKRGYRLIREDSRFYPTVRHYVRDSLETGNVDRAVELVARHREWGLNEAHTEYAHLMFAAAARAAFLRLGHLGKPLPVELGDVRANGKSATEVAEDLIAQAETLAAGFDTRNANSYFGDMLAADHADATR